MGNKLCFTLIVLSLFVILIFVGCSQDDDDNGNGNGEGPTEEQLDEAEGYMDKQSVYFLDYEALLADLDTAVALDSLVSLLANDPDVVSAVNVKQGVNITWASGLRGGIVTGFKLESPDTSDRSFFKSPSIPSSKSVNSFNAPQSNKAIFLAPCNAEFAMWDAIVIRDSKAAMTSAGYDTFTIYKEEECNLERMRSLTGGGYGIVRISSHGIPWPDQNNVEEVYLVTGEEATRESIENTWQYLENYFLVVQYVNGANRYCMESAYFAFFNDFGNDKPFVSLGFCYSGLGHWPTDIMNTCNAGAVMGWDWSIYCNSDCAFIVDFLRDMCDTLRENPLTGQDWMATGEKRIWDPQDSRYINVVFDAVDSFVLALPFKLTSVFPPAGYNTYGLVAGKGFGDEQGSSVVKFGDVEVDISWWRDDTIIVYIRSSELPHGEVPVTVVVAGKESNSVPFYNGIDVSYLHSFEMELFINTNYTNPSGSYEDYWNFDVPEYYEIPGNFIGNTMNIVLDTLNPSWDRNEHIEISVSVDDPSRMITNLSVTRSVEWPNRFTSSLTITAENIPIIYLGGGYGSDLITLQAQLEGIETCSHITSLTYQELDSLGNPTHTLTSYDCDTTDYSTSLDIYMRNHTR
ncbi:IPT/TIG domain-containing protein [bacterium]|nr:IPT/TIG domain-containing protein [bacterium]